MTTITRRRRSQALLASGVILAAALAGCSAAGERYQRPASATSTSTPDDETMAIVTCYRTHGDPSFPDPVYDPSDGRWHFAVSPGSAPASTQQACQHLFPSHQRLAARPAGPVPAARPASRVHQAARRAQLAGPGPGRLVPAAAVAQPEGRREPGCGRPAPAQRYLPSSGHIDVHAVA